ncbi:hypothetical protein EMIT047CA2_90014 [Pseudomonas soli]
MNPPETRSRQHQRNVSPVSDTGNGTEQHSGIKRF